MSMSAVEFERTFLEYLPEDVWARATSKVPSHLKLALHSQWEKKILSGKIFFDCCCDTFLFLFWEHFSFFFGS